MYKFCDIIINEVQMKPKYVAVTIFLSFVVGLSIGLKMDESIRGQFVDFWHNQYQQCSKEKLSLLRYGR
jgi:hypothetical protein